MYLVNWSKLVEALRREKKYLYLFYYEYNYMQKLMKLDYGKALKFNFTARYIDDLLSLNNTLFMNEIPNIYPQELVLK